MGRLILVIVALLVVIGWLQDQPFWPALEKALHKIAGG